MTLWPVVGLYVNIYWIWNASHTRLREVLIYGHKDKSIRGDLILCPLNRIIVVGSPLWSLTSLSTGSWPNNDIDFILWKRNKSNQKVVGVESMACEL